MTKSPGGARRERDNGMALYLIMANANASIIMHFVTKHKTFETSSMNMTMHSVVRSGPVIRTESKESIFGTW